jgi:tetratricopeptide (TPR) repeat protein
MTLKTGRTVWTVSIAAQWIAALVVFLILDYDKPTKVLIFAAIALPCNIIAYYVARGSGVQAPWEVFLSALFSDKQVDAAEEMRLAWKAVDAGDDEGAAAHFGTVLQADPTRPDALFGRGQALQRMGQTDAALADFSRTLSMKPDMVGARQARAALYLQRGNVDGAIDDLNEVLRLETADAASYRQRGTALAKRGDLEAALKDLKEAVRLNPNDAEAHFECGKAYEAQGDVNHALTEYTEAGRLDPTGPGRAAKAELQQKKAASKK